MASKAERDAIVKKEVVKMTRLLRRYEAAVRAHETRGGGRPEDVDAIEREFKEVRELMEMNIGYFINKAYT